MKKSEFFKVEGDRITRVRKYCPKCGPAIFLAEHKNRLSCGKCGYTEFKGGGKPVEAPKEEPVETKEEAPVEETPPAVEDQPETEEPEPTGEEPPAEPEPPKEEVKKE
jgi:small subunit ribosomal protein S27Ae